MTLVFIFAPNIISIQNNAGRRKRQREASKRMSPWMRRTRASAHTGAPSRRSGGGAADEGEAELAKAGSVPLLIGGLEGGEPLIEELAGRIRLTGTGESGRLIGQAQRPRLPHGERRENECFRFPGSLLYRRSLYRP